MLKQHHKLALIFLTITDVLVTALAWAAAMAVHYAIHESLPTVSELWPAVLASVVLVVPLFIRFRLYEAKRISSLWIEMIEIAQAILTLWALTFVFTSVLMKTALPRTLMLAVLIIWLLLAAGSRLLARLILHRIRNAGHNVRSAAIIGTGRLGQKLFHAMHRNRWMGIQPDYFVGDHRVDSEMLGLHVFGPIGQIDDILTRQPVDIVFVALGSERAGELELALDKLTNTHSDVRVVPDLLDFHFLKHDITQVDNLPIITLTHSPQHGWNSLLKRTFDIVVSMAAIVFFALPMLAIAIAVAIASGRPVLYRQTRASLGGKPFKIIKFRSMQKDAEAKVGPVWAVPNDDRCTPIGRFLRRTSLDELPQLFNVLLGHMSLVGPRPERPELIERFRRQVPRYMLRHQVKAGLTGWAQVHGMRGQTSLRKRVRYDLYYIMNWTFWLDLWILLMTPFRSIVSRNAY